MTPPDSPASLTGQHETFVYLSRLTPKLPFASDLDMRTLLSASLTLLLCATGLSGCYFRNQKAFERRVEGLVSVGMPVQQALARLSDLRLTCTVANPADCSRIRQSLMPYSCVERVRVYWMEQTQRVTRIEIPPIACAGL